MPCLDVGVRVGVMMPVVRSMLQVYPRSPFSAPSVLTQHLQAARRSRSDFAAVAEPVSEAVQPLGAATASSARPRLIMSMRWVMRVESGVVVSRSKPSNTSGWSR